MNFSSFTRLAPLLLVALTALNESHAQSQSTQLAKPAVITSTNLTSTFVGTTVQCPKEILVGGVSVPSGWTSTPTTIIFESSVMATPDVMHCTYDHKVYGNPVVVFRRVKPQFKSCVANNKGFLCEKP